MKQSNIFGRRIWWCVLLLSFVALSCETAIDRQMDEIEQVLSTQPEAAYEKLLAMDSGKLRPECRRARYALLLSLARDKSYIDVTDDSLILAAVRYYDMHGSQSDRMLSFYSLGRVQSNAGNNTEAIISFLQAKDLAEAIPDKHYYGLITRNMAELYGSVSDHDTELLYYKKSSKAFFELGEVLYSAYSVLGEARANMARGKYEQADSLLQSLEDYSRREQEKNLLASVLQTRALMQMRPGWHRPEITISLSREAERMGFPPEYVDGYGVMALAFESLHQLDSARYYIGMAEKCTKTLLDSIQLLNTKYWILDQRKDYHEANIQLENGVRLHNRMVFNRESQQIANAITAFSRQEAAQQARVSRHRLELLFLSVITILALLGIMVMILINRRRQLREKTKVIMEKERKIEEDMAQLQEISDELQGERESRTEMARAVNDLIAEKIAVVKMCADAYETVKNEPKEDPRDLYRYLDEDPAKKKTEEMQRFLRALERFREDQSLFFLLEDSVNKWRDNIMVRLRTACVMDSEGKRIFTEDDFRLLMLFYAGIPDRTIAFLMDMSCAAVRTRKTRYKERLAQNDIPEGAFFLLKLAASPSYGANVTTLKK